MARETTIRQSNDDDADVDPRSGKIRVPPDMSLQSAFDDNEEQPEFDEALRPSKLRMSSGKRLLLNGFASC